MHYYSRRRRTGALWAVACLAVVLGVAAGLTLIPTTEARRAVVTTGAQARSDNATTKPKPAPASSEKPSASGRSPSPSPSPSVKPSSGGHLWIDVDLTAQRVYIKSGDQVVKTMVTSSGAPGNDTPQGTFAIQNRGEWFFSEKYQEGAKWWVSFKDWGVYLFHSVVMDRDKEIIPAEEAKLGTPASHGCLRLAVDDAKWIYDNIPQGAKVVIHS